MADDRFERLYAEYSAPLFAFLVYRTGERDLAEDLLADTFEHALRARRGFDRRRASERTWLYSIAINLARDRPGATRPRAGPSSARRARTNQRAAISPRWRPVWTSPGRSSAWAPKSARRSRCVSAPT